MSLGFMALLLIGLIFCDGRRRGPQVHARGADRWRTGRRGTDRAGAGRPGSERHDAARVSRVQGAPRRAGGVRGDAEGESRCDGGSLPGHDRRLERARGARRDCSVGSDAIRQAVGDKCTLPPPGGTTAGSDASATGSGAGSGSGGPVPDPPVNAFFSDPFTLDGGHNIETVGQRAVARQQLGRCHRGSRRGSVRHRRQPRRQRSSTTPASTTASLVRGLAQHEGGHRPAARGRVHPARRGPVRRAAASCRSRSRSARACSAASTSRGRC